MSIDVLIPIADEQVLSARVLHGLRIQTIDTAIIIASSPRPDGGKLAEHIAEAANRNRMIAGVRGEFTVLMDSDVVMTEENTLEICISELRNRPELDAIAIDTKGIGVRHHEELGHVVIALVVVRSDKLRGYTFRVDEKVGSCTCIDFNRHFKIAYTRAVSAIEEERK